MVKSLLVTLFAVGAITSSIVIGKNLIEEAPLAGLPKQQQQKDPENIKELLTNKGYGFLDVEGKQDDEKWTNLINKYISLKDENKIKKIKDLEFKSKGNSFNNEDIQTFKTKCQELLRTQITKGNEFELSKQNTIDWCTDKTSRPINVS
ncbi:hypothetical protein A6V39_00035 [Candidatus Mycoplasma haematobovis]|uniref:Uncharacterized protein n=1 Tax=Candidatus Mycoplasma haematobovis TaxID=432608 RepID=A0A1A9QD88_9MOLU|nr:hypothetical protein [Candidatus Mycoplasma haematobovis]OAL10437.1 hypothetical protein A6V39_00035 [Candidatus Mycoplasma haematobovis]